MPIWLLYLLLPPLLEAQVWIELPGASAENLTAVRNGCEKALGPGRCGVGATLLTSDEGPAPVAAPHRARVTWTADWRTARIRLQAGDRGGGGAGGARSGAELRELTFAEEDSIAARFEAIGLVVAAYVIGHRRASAAMTLPAAPPALAPGPAGVRPRWTGDVMLGMGSAFDRGRARLLVGLRGGLRPLDGPLFALIQGQLGRRFDPVEVTFIAGGLGAGLWLRTPWPALDLQLHLSAVVERVIVSATHPETGVQASDGRLRLGGQLGIAVLSCMGSGVCLWGGIHVNSLYPALRLEIRGISAGDQGPLGFDGVLGIRVAR